MFDNFLIKASYQEKLILPYFHVYTSLYNKEGLWGKSTNQAQWIINTECTTSGSEIGILFLCESYDASHEWK